MELVPYNIEVAHSLDEDVVSAVVKNNSFERKSGLYSLILVGMYVIAIYVIIKKSLYRIFGKTPKINCWLFDGLAPSCRNAKEGAGSWKALEAIYEHPFDGKNIVDDFWENNVANAQAVRNRLKLVKQEVKRALMSFATGQEIRILSLACGSAQGIIEIVSLLTQRGFDIRVMLLDHNQEALDYAQRLAVKRGIGDRVELVKADITFAAKYIKNFKPQVVEMLGLLDYLPDDLAVRLISSIQRYLSSGSIFLTCNINYNPEKLFVTNALDWPMIYRSPADLIDIISKAGFGDFRLIYEPFMVHGVIIAPKS